MRVLVCGSRTFKDEAWVQVVVMGLQANVSVRGTDLTIIHGAAPGADSLAGRLAQISRGVIREEAYPAEWEKYGKRAGPIRNQQMLEQGDPDLVVAFIDKPLEESRGTFDMVKRAWAADLPVTVVHTWS